MSLNPYNSALDPFYPDAREAVPRLGQLVTPSDTVQFSYYQQCVVVAAGNVKFLPVCNDPSDPITMTNLPVGYVIPWQLTQVFATDTTATLRTLEKTFPTWNNKPMV
jgi:hypothetical protein